MRKLLRAHVVGASLLTGCSGRVGGDGTFEAPPPPAEALLSVGVHDGTRILPGGRAITPTGTQTELGGYPAEVIAHPTLDVVYVNNVGYGLRGVQVVSRSTGTLLQTVSLPESWHGLTLSPDGTELYQAGGDARSVRVFTVSPTDGQLTLARTLALSIYAAGVSLNAAGDRLYTADYKGGVVHEVDPQTGAKLRQVSVGGTPFSVLKVPGRDELYVTDAQGTEVIVVELGGFTVAGRVALGGDAPMGLESTPDGARVFVSVTDAERVVAIATATRTIVADRRLGEAELADDEGTLLAGISPAGTAYDATRNRLYVARAGDNVVAVLDGTSLAPLGTIPTAWYPTDVAVDGDFVAVSNGKGLGAGPTRLLGPDNAEGKALMNGTLSSFDVGNLDLAERTRQAYDNWTRPDRVYRLDAGGRTTPLPTAPGGPTPIQHIVLIVRENKTYDSVLGDLADTEADPSRLEWGPAFTPNAHALAREFANHDNFYDDSESSVQGHFWLTYVFVNHFMEHISYLEDYRGNPGFGYDAAKSAARPDVGNYFQHLIRNGIDFRIFGEVVGQAASAVGPDGMMRSTSDYLDFDFPGLFYNTDIRDELKARHFIQNVEDYGLPPFVYLLLPNDHTHGLSPGALTPGSMIADNDYATGLVVEALSQRPEWESTAIFIVQDDTQSGADHVDLHRSLLFVVSPWAKHAYTSHVHTSYPSLFRTFDHILGIGPLNRYDALATPLYDSFTSTPDLTPYVARPRETPDTTNPMNFQDRARQVAASWSSQLDFTVPDASPVLGDILAVAATGRAPEGSELARVIAGELPDNGPPSEGEAEEEERYERSLEAFHALVDRDPWLQLRLRDELERLRLMPR